MSNEKVEQFEEGSIDELQNLSATGFLKSYYSNKKAKFLVCSGILIILLIFGARVLILCQQKEGVIVPQASHRRRNEVWKGHEITRGHDHPNPEWLYPTLGCPNENKKNFNFSRVELKDSYQWEEKMSDLLFKPYNVIPYGFRTPTASSRGMG